MFVNEILNNGIFIKMLKECSERYCETYLDYVVKYLYVSVTLSTTSTLPKISATDEISPQNLIQYINTNTNMNKLFTIVLLPTSSRHVRPEPAPLYHADTSLFRKPVMA